MGNCCNSQVFNILEKQHQEHASVPLAAESPQVQAGTSIERLQSETEVSPKSVNRTISPAYQRKPPIRTVKVVSRKCMFGSNTLRQMCWQCPVYKRSKQAQPATSTERPQSEMEVSPEPSNNTTSTANQQKPQGRMEKVISKKRRCVSTILKEISQTQAVVPLNEDKPQVITSTSRETSHIKTEVVDKNADNAPSPGEERESPVMMVKVVLRMVSPEEKGSALDEVYNFHSEVDRHFWFLHMFHRSNCGGSFSASVWECSLVEFKKRKRIPAILRGICQKKAVAAPQGPPISEAPSAETTHMKIEELPEHDDNVSSPENQEKTPVKVKFKKRRRIPAILSGICRKNTITPQDMEEPLGSVHPSAKTTEVKTKELPEHVDNVSSPENQEKTPVKMEYRKFKGISSMFQRFYKKRSVTSQDVEEHQASKSSKEALKSQQKGTQNSPAIKEIFCREEEFNPHNEGAWEEYKSYFPSGVQVPESKHTTVSTLIGSYTAQVGDTDVEDQQNIDSTESFPEAFEVQQWELRKISSTIVPVVNVLYLAPPKSSDEDIVSIKKKKKKRRKRYY